MRSSELFRRRLVVIVLCCTFFVAVWRCVVTYARKTKEICVESTSVHANHFPLGKQITNKPIIIVVVAFLFEEKTKRERGRDPSEKRRPKRIIVIIIGKRNGRTMRDALKDAFFCVHTAQQVVGFLSPLFFSLFYF